MQPWRLGDAKTVTLRSVRATPQTKVSVLGQSDEIVEYKPEVKPKTSWSQDETGLHITAYRGAETLYGPALADPIVLKITDATPPA